MNPSMTMRLVWLAIMLLAALLIAVVACALGMLNRKRIPAALLLGASTFGGALGVLLAAASVPSGLFGCHFAPSFGAMLSH